MLRELAVQNLATIEDVRVELRPGFCAWTGETGAGKSLLLGALGLLLGERGSADLIRHGADELRVAGCFELSLPAIKAEAERVLDRALDDQVLVSRRLHRGGRSQAYIDDQPAALQTLKRLGAVLIDLHGQRESLSLLEPAYQLRLLDAFGDLEEAREAFDAHATECRELRRRYRELADRREARRKEISLIRFEREELSAADLAVGEVEELTGERDRLAHAQALQDFCGTVTARLYDDEGSVVERVGRLVKESANWAGMDPRLADVSKRLGELVPEMRELASNCRHLAEQFEADPGRLDEAERRLAFLKRLEQKYRRPIDDLIDYKNALDAQEQSLQADEASTEGIEREIHRAAGLANKAGAMLSKGRQRIAKRLAAEAQKHLASLGMQQATLDACLTTAAPPADPLADEMPCGGFDHLELMLAANPGEPSRPLRKVASGGEMSRAMLALKSVLADHDPVGTLIFDEIDANVGGRLGDVLGQRLAALGKARQVICVTHLPQVASYAEHHWTIRKATRDGRVSTTISPLRTEADRLDEVARMMRGEAAVETTRREAAEMLRAGRQSEKVIPGASAGR